MKYKIEFQYKGAEDARPEDCVQDEPIDFDGGEFIPIPNVGDTVGYIYGEKEKAFMVVSRHFLYRGNWCVVNIVVTDVSEEEMASRLKE